MSNKNKKTFRVELHCGVVSMELVCKLKTKKEIKFDRKLNYKKCPLNNNLDLLK